MAWEGDDKGPGQLNSLGPASQFTVSKSRRSNVPGRFRREVCWIYGGSFRADCAHSRARFLLSYSLWESQFEREKGEYGKLNL